MNDTPLPVGYVFDIKRYAIHDGPGIRITVFLQGCPLRCWWCHNPEGIRAIPDPQEETFRFKPHRIMSVSELLREIEKEILFFDESGGGVTFSGGEPLIQHRFLKTMLTECRKREIHTAVDTSGYAPSEIVASIADSVDLFLFDLKLLDDDAHQTYTGVSNKPIIENLQTLVDRGREIVIRFPLIPGITDSEENLSRLIEHLSTLRRIKTLHLLPYHKTAREKYRRLQIDDRTKEILPPSLQQVEAVKIRLENTGLNVHIGG